ncbi:IS66 family transposase [Thiocapsa bogorovii]|nr:IS66 family transposase [Thiocapsa bogorovii]
MSDQLAQSERERAEQSLQLEQHSNTLQQQTRRIDQLLEYIELLRRKRFGRSADRIPESQLGLFDETELEALIAELEAELPADTAPPATPAEDTLAPPKGKPVRRPLPSHLPRVERILDLPEAEKAAMGEDWVLIGYDSSEQLAVIPRQTYVIEYKRAKYVARNEDVPGAEVGVKIAPRPAQIIPKSIAHSSLLASIVTAKFVDALPLYRQETIFAREGIALGRQTMAGLLIQLQVPLQPVAAALKDLLRRGAVVHIDETPVQVLREPGREDTQDSYMWVFCGGPPGTPVRWFEYAPSRAAEVPRRVLFASDVDPPPLPLYLQSDGYGAYGVLAAAPGVIGHAGCWAHVRRKFVDAANGRNAGAAQQMVALIGELYARWSGACATPIPRPGCAGVPSTAGRSSCASAGGSIAPPPACFPKACSARPSAMPSANGRSSSPFSRTGTWRSTTTSPRTPSGPLWSGERTGSSPAVPRAPKPARCSTA